MELRDYDYRGNDVMHSVMLSHPLCWYHKKACEVCQLCIRGCEFERVLVGVCVLQEHAMPLMLTAEYCPLPMN